MKLAGFIGLAFLFASLTSRAQTQITGAELCPLRIFSATQAVAAVTVGDFDPLHSGNELACLMADGSVVELAFGVSNWTANPIFQYKGGTPWNDPTMRVTLNVGDVLPEQDDREIVLSFQQKVVAVYYLPSFGWTNEVVTDLTGFVATTWGAETGDGDPTHPGEEVFSIVENVLDFSNGTLFGETNGLWHANQVYSAEVGMDAAIGDSNPDLAGNEIIVVTEMGPAYEIKAPATGGTGPWPKRTIWDDFDNAAWVVKIGDVERETPGNELVYGTRYNDRIMLSRYNDTNMHDVEILVTGISTNQNKGMFDVAIGRVFPGASHPQIFGVDASGSVYMVQRVTNQGKASSSGEIRMHFMHWRRRIWFQLYQEMKSWPRALPARDLIVQSRSAHKHGF
jgi:hypothetical protein